jgi:hypothetical protein
LRGWLALVRSHAEACRGSLGAAESFAGKALLGCLAFPALLGRGLASAYFTRGDGSQPCRGVPGIAGSCRVSLVRRFSAAQHSQCYSAVAWPAHISPPLSITCNLFSQSSLLPFAFTFTFTVLTYCHCHWACDPLQAYLFSTHL